MSSGTQPVESTGFRAPLFFSQAIAALAQNISVAARPQYDFRGENLVIDTTVVGPNCTVSAPTVGSIPQTIGGGTVQVPGTLFSPAQYGALDFEMFIAQQGNDMTILVTSTLTATTLAFACAIFGHSVQGAAGVPLRTGGVAMGVMVPGSFQRR